MELKAHNNHHHHNPFFFLFVFISSLSLSPPPPPHLIHVALNGEQAVDGGHELLQVPLRVSAQGKLAAGALGHAQAFELELGRCHRRPTQPDESRQAPIPWKKTKKKENEKLCRSC